MGPQISESYESYFGIDYPIAKQDQFGIPPLDYAAGAMENWGLITYRYTYYISCYFNNTDKHLQAINFT